MAWICNYILGEKYIIITHRASKTNGGLTKAPLNLGPEWINSLLPTTYRNGMNYWSMSYTTSNSASKSVLLLWSPTLRPSDAIWRHKSGSTLAQVMACCLTAPSHCLNQCWLIISKAFIWEQFYSPQPSVIEISLKTITYPTFCSNLLGDNELIQPA